jgi:hypothetical protein
MQSKRLMGFILLSGIVFWGAVAAARSETSTPILLAQADSEAEGAASAEGEPPEATPPEAAAETEDSAASAQPETTATEPGAYMVRLKGLEQRVNELKERIFRSKARLNLLKETVLHGVIAGSRSVIRHKNEMGRAFRLEKLVYALDGTQIFSKVAEDDSLDQMREFDVFNGKIVPGNHTLTTMMIYRGHGYGIFTYLKGYRFTVRASHTFTAAEGRQNLISVLAYEKGNATTELKDRPAVKFETSVYKVAEGKKAEGEAQ